MLSDRLAVLRRDPRLVAATAFGAVGLSVTAMGVYAGLQAEATKDQTVTAGKLDLQLSAATPSAGFSTAITGLAPGDTVYRYVDLTDASTIDVQNLTLKVSDGASGQPLTTGTTTGLKAGVAECSTAWTVDTSANGGLGTGSCGGTTSTPLAPGWVSGLSSAATLGGTQAKGGTRHFQVAVTLVATETTTNGTPPTGTVQNKSANLTWTFTEDQRTASTTHG